MQYASSPLEGLPLPTAALVIDTRSKTAGNYILDTLKYEIDTLCQEMRIERVNQWRFLTSIIDYLPLGTLSHSELQSYRAPHKVQAKNGTNGVDNQPTTGAADSHNHNQQHTKTIMGPVSAQTTAQNFFRGSPQRRSLDEIPEGNFKNNIRRILSTCDVLRTKRVNATVDLGTQGSPGQTRAGEGIVRIIFIVDAQSEDSLATAATYAAYLRREMLFHDLPGPQVLISTMIICLNHDNRGDAPRMLIDALSWEDDASWPHIDSCILMETYSEHGAKNSAEVQEEHIEFLLYVLLITDPYQLRIDIHSPDITALLHENATWRMLPVEKCYSIGLSAFTYSVRWGRHLLNSSFTASLAQILTDRPQSLASSANKVSAQRWLEEQLMTVKGAIPEQVAADIPELNAITQAKTTARPASSVFPSRSLSTRVGKRSLQALDQYEQDLEETYTSSTPQKLSLQDAILQEMTIPEYVARWQGDAGSPLMKVLTNAYRVLIDQRFFDKNSGKGAVTRAKQQLHMLAETIAERQKQHQGHVIDPIAQRAELHRQYEKERKTLEDFDQRFPLLGRHFKWLIAVLSVILWFFVALIAGLAGMAWLHSLVLFHAQPVLALFDQEIFGLFSIFNVLTIIVVLLLLTITVYICIRTLFGTRATPLRVETAFLTSLGIFSLFGLIVSLSLANLVEDSVALGLISWLAPLPNVSILTLLILIVVLVIELAYFLKWHQDIIKERARIVDTLNKQHLAAVEAIRLHLAETFLIALLQKARLVDETGTKDGRYYSAIEQLHLLLGKVQEQAEERYQTIQQHLERITENQVQGPASSKLYLREELLDITTLNHRRAILEDNMDTQPHFIELTELLLRSFGVEATDAIIRDIEQRPHLTNALLMDNYQYEMQLLLSMIAAEALELSIEPLPLALPGTDLLESRYKALDYHYQHAVIRNLIDQVKSKVAIRLSKNRKQAPGEIDTALAVTALTAWAQMLWEHDEQIRQILTQEGVLARMEHEHYSAETMRTKFIIRVAPLSRSLHFGQQTDTYLITFPTNKGSRLLRELDIASITVNFPDEELLALLSLSHYVSMPYKVEEEPVLQLEPAADNNSVNSRGSADNSASNGAST